MTPLHHAQAQAVRTIISNDEQWLDLLRKHINTDDYHQAAGTFCTDVLAPMLDRDNWAPVPFRLHGMEHAATDLLFELLPNGNEWWIRDEVADMMREETSE